MRKYIGIRYLAFLLIFGLGSCKDYLDVVPDNLATLDNAFTDRFNAEKFLLTCYSYLPGSTSLGGNPAMVAGDELILPSEFSNNNGPSISRGFQSATDPIMNYWNGSKGGTNLHIAIRDCNIFLERIEAVPDIQPFELKKWVAEVKFLKAYYHFYLIRLYGPIHIIDKNLPIDASIDDVKLHRDPLPECFKYVVDLMDESVEDLPVLIQNEVTELGRITKPIALAMKARVLLTWASPLFNGNPELSDVVDENGVKIFGDTPDPTLWEKAKEAYAEAIEVADQAGFKLYEKSDYRTVYDVSETTKEVAALRNRLASDWNTEVIWGLNKGTSSRELQRISHPRLDAYSGNPVRQYLGVSLRVAEQYYSKNGVPINEDKAFDFENRFSRKEAGPEHKLHIREGQETARLHFDREPRFYADLAFDRGIWYGNGRFEKESESWWVRARKGEVSSAANRGEYSATGYWPKKFVNIESEINANGTTFGSIPFPFPMVRLAELYLGMAEAINEAEGPANAYQWIDKVRTRAGLGGVVESWRDHSSTPDKPATKEGFREILQRERLIELAFENHRFYDLRRWKVAPQYLNGPIKGWNINAEDAAGYYQVQNLYNQSFGLRDYFWPIKESELQFNAKLIQNPGW
ncbi:hypothetical protein FUAX_10520 [Fulvitalea axinellae]|uniref:RagB/SusD family nutrient uptake outer membrane protein n=1 Tax=Fulvitalea axinellae TaxID=1182444 RepID=A0AAU9DCP2_9BACT|nr:hypothetical protein FUAX_10520 [Fulvitalea axinellae]